MTRRLLFFSYTNHSQLEGLPCIPIVSINATRLRRRRTYPAYEGVGLWAFVKCEPVSTVSVSEVTMWRRSLTLVARREETPPDRALSGMWIRESAAVRVPSGIGGFISCRG
jgi:hypothetical protein